MTLKSEYLFATVAATIIFTALMATNVAQFYQPYRAYKEQKSQSRTTIVVYTPLNISSSIFLSLITILLVNLVYGLIKLQALFAVSDLESNSNRSSALRTSGIL